MNNLSELLDMMNINNNIEASARKRKIKRNNDNEPVAKKTTQRRKTTINNNIEASARKRKIKRNNNNEPFAKKQLRK